MTSQDRAAHYFTWILSLLALILLLLGIYSVLQPFLISIGWALILVLVTWPLHERLRRKWPAQPTLTALLMTTMLALIVAAAIVPLFIALSNELRSAAESIEQWLTVGSVQVPPELRALPWVGSLIPQDHIDIRIPGTQALDLISGYRSQIVGAITVAAKGFFSLLGKFFLCLLTAFFLYRGGAEVAQQLKLGLFRIGGERFEHLFGTLKMTIKGGVYGMLFTALAQGLLAGMGYVAAGTPVPILLGCLTMLLSLIPFGTPLVYLPAAVIVVLNGAPWWHGALLAAWGIAVVSTADNIFRTLFISQATEMPLLLVFFGVLGGILSFGLIGILIGPALLALAHALWLEWCVVPSTNHKSIEPQS